MRGLRSRPVGPGGPRQWICRELGPGRPRTPSTSQEEWGPCCILWPRTGLSPAVAAPGRPSVQTHSLQEEWARARPVLARDRSEQRGSKRQREMAPELG